MADPLLQYYTDETWGYDRYDEKEKLQAGIEVLEQQQPEESREDFFNRIGIAPKRNMYGSLYKLDKEVNRKNEYTARCEAAEQGYGLDKLINDEDTLVRRTVVLDEMKNKYLNMKNALNDNDMDTLETIYPVGSIYTSIDNSLPDFIKNLGTWEPVLAGYPITNGSIITDVIPVNTTGYMWKRTS